ncbi:MAG: hypothetical protein IKM62_05075 [Kiritimatiellae bacterium]|nr:hypothetical protein [Kiritimatiellia bacterium]
MKRSVFIFIGLLSGLLLASEKIEYRDAQGRLQDSARAQNGKVEYRNAQGRLQGSARAQNGKTEYRDAQGRFQGSAREVNGKTEYRDAQGRLQGSARNVNGKIEYRDAQGRLQGTAREVNGKMEYRDAQGRLHGSKRTRGWCSVSVGLLKSATGDVVEKPQVMCKESGGLLKRFRRCCPGNIAETQRELGRNARPISPIFPNSRAQGAFRCGAWQKSVALTWCESCD